MENKMKLIENFSVKNGRLTKEDNEIKFTKTEKKIMTGEKRNFWKKLLGVDNVPENQKLDKLITSVAVRNEGDLETIKKSFEQNQVVHIYEFHDMTLEEAKNLDHVKKTVEMRAKAQIYTMI